MADIYDPSDGNAPPSKDLTRDGDKAPGPKSFPIKKAGQLKISGWTIYAEGEKLFAESPKGVKTQFVLFDPSGLLEDAKPNKVSDSSDGSKNSKGLTPATSIGSQSSSGSSGSVSAASSSDSSSTSTTQTSTNDTGTSTSVASVAEVAAASAPVEDGSYETIYETTPTKTVKSSNSPLQANVGSKPPGNYTGTYFINQDEKGKPSADAFLGRTLEPDEWDDLVATVYSEVPAGLDLDKAWVMGTILNRARQAGLRVGQVILDTSQFTTVGPNPSNQFREGPNDSVDSTISAAALLLNSVAKNNFYYEKSVEPMLYKAGVLGIPITTITVFPGARWY